MWFRRIVVLAATTSTAAVVMAAPASAAPDRTAKSTPDRAARSTTTDRKARSAADPPDICRVCHTEPPSPGGGKPNPKPRPKTKRPGRRTCKNPGKNPGGKYSYLAYEARKGGRVVYVGITRSFRSRCNAHRRGSLGDLFGSGAGPKDGIVAFSNLHFLSLPEARQVEQVLIEKYGFRPPKDNLNKNLDTGNNPGRGQLRNRRNEISAADGAAYCLAVGFGRAELIQAKYSSRAKDPFMRRRNCAI